MMSETEFVDYWKRRLRRDISPFADPGTRVEVTATNRVIDAKWTDQNQTRNATFTVSLESGVEARFRQERYSYPSFLASSEMGDLRQLARMVMRSSEASVFVEPEATAEKPDGSRADGSALQLLREMINSEGSVDATGLVFITGDAGAGKTRALRELVRLQAERYLDGEETKLFLYIDAQGRALARFNEALALELQDLRAQITYHAVATLVRASILVPVIDGFDELLGTGSYDDPFAALAAFLEELDGHGAVVASARSTYLQEEFLSRANSTSLLGRQSWSLLPVNLAEWTERQVSLDYSQRGLFSRPVLM